MECRKRSLTYSAPIFVDIKYTLGNQIMSKRGLRIGQIPIMLHSSKCVLRGKSPAELAKMQECLYDPGGYFIVRGAEKVLLMQEQLSKNRILVDMNDDGTIVVGIFIPLFVLCNYQANVTSATTERITRCYVLEKKGRLYLKHNVFSKDIPICIAFRCMGIESDQEIMALVSNELYLVLLFMLIVL